MNRIESRYDWIVLGDHPSALLCANLVSKLGLSVLSVPFSKRMIPMLSSQGQYLDPDTNIVCGIGKQQSGLLGIAWNRISGAQDYPESEWIRDRRQTPRDE